MKEEMKEKMKALFKASPVDAVFLSSTHNDVSFSYFTGLPKFVYSNYLVLKPKQAALFSSNLDVGAVKANLENKAVKVKEFSKKDEFLALMEKELKNVKTVGLNLSMVPQASLKQLKKIFKGRKLVDVSSQLAKLREIKTAIEIKKLRKAVSLSEAVIEELLPKIKPGRSEKEIQIELDCLIAGKGGKPSFESIVASGKNAFNPHHISSKKKLKKRELLLIDFGVSFQNYCADLSRVYCLGKASPKQKKLYKVVYKALQQSLKEVREGNQAKNAFLAAEKELNKAGFKMIHSLGHGIGLEDHDFPGRINAESKFSFEKNMVLAVEPAVYLKNWGGIRLEDNLVVKKARPEMLSHASAELVEI